MIKSVAVLTSIATSLYINITLQVVFCHTDMCASSYAKEVQELWLCIKTVNHLNLTQYTQFMGCLSSFYQTSVH